MPLLDFDVVCGSLPSLVLRRWAELGDEPEAQSVLSDPVGPHTASRLLSTIEHFSLPPGSAAELLWWRKQLTGATSRAAARFVDVMKRARGSPDPVRVVMDGRSSYGNVAQVLLSDLEEFVEPVPSVVESEGGRSGGSLGRDLVRWRPGSPNRRERTAVGRVYQIAETRDRKALTEFLVREGQYLLPFVELI
ncbi:MAG: hypothetical protein FJX75_26355, partial [Armatimonadetes bacterium]|nr:hypothetical protein [Armatimonadota bacterium]